MNTNIKVNIDTNDFCGSVLKDQPSDEMIIERIISGTVFINDNSYYDTDFTISGPVSLYNSSNKYEVYLSSNLDTDIFYIDECPTTEEEIISFLKTLKYF